MSASLEHDLRHPPLRVTIDDVAARLAATRRPEAVRAPLRNPHHEPKVTAEQRRRAVPASVLIPLVDRPAGATLLMTRRHEAISYPGHVCFPGGRADATDRDVEHTALREAHEEVGLAPGDVRLIGRLGDYVSHSGFRIAPVLGVVALPMALLAAPGEVDEILEIPLEHALDARAYRLERVESDPPRGYWVLEHGSVHVTGPTVGILIGLYEALLGL